MFEPTKLVIVALPAELFCSKCTKPPVKSSLLPATPAVIVAVPAVLEPEKTTGPKPKTWIIAGPAVLELLKVILPPGSSKLGALPVMPLPVIVKF